MENNGTTVGCQHQRKDGTVVCCTVIRVWLDELSKDGRNLSQTALFLNEI
jgi:hypothetical protein